ncbi:MULTISPECIES: DUF6913 domain-containing protein [Tenacibaculum]|uniref:DUF6913 domain-containing protein n=1 Tax=Tenacibaculum TaxID=104267 RepID=UPI001F0A85AA|nr:MULTISPECIES: hypothetical protein [Tenacibaculum]MCH3882542.1 hypothetical protein [Tenacibaculum aquimarinum]MDO6599972.1 hypothetical protein [Tenacibaculum sp. 1_MG-2023]
MFNFFKKKETVLAKRLAKLQLETLVGSKSNKVKTVAIITTEEISQKYNLQSLVEKSLAIKNTKIYSFRKFDKQNEISTIHFSEKDLAKSGKVVDEDFNTFLNKPFDLLIGFFDANHLYLEYATAKSKATYKVGFANVNADLFELEIHSKADNTSEFLSELKKYLQILDKL